MKGLAQRLFADEEEEVELLADVDLFFAERLLKESGGGNSAQKGVLGALLCSARQGHLCLPLEEKEHLLGASELSPLLLEQVDESAVFPKRPVCRFGKYLYLQKNWFAETRFLNHLKRLLAFPALSKITIEDASLTDEQKHAVESSLALPLSVISGGPGTGKTFTAASIVRTLLKQKSNARVVLAAPTAKAAKQLERNLEGLNLNAMTLHALLDIHKDSELVEEPSPLQADLVIVDECSMIDARIFSYLLASIGDSTHLVLMGDPDQLPPVETGSLFADLVRVLRTKFSAHLSSLTRLQRFEQNAIAQFVEAVRQADTQGVLSQLMHAKTEALTYTELSSHRVERAYEMIWRESENGNFVILSCLRKGPFGVDALNQMLRERCEQEKRDSTRGVPILITRTDEELGLCNGETGLLFEDGAVFNSAPHKKIPRGLLPPYEYAFCLSVHKSQGSEYEQVLLIIPPGSENFGREVVYTGATRAKKRLKIVSDLTILQKVLERGSRKISALHERVR